VPRTCQQRLRGAEQILHVVRQPVERLPPDRAHLELAGRLLDEQVERSLGWTVHAGVDAAAAGMTAAALRALAEELVAALRS